MVLSRQFPPLNLHLALRSFLDEYITVDLPCIRALKQTVAERTAARQALRKMASSYQIARNFHGNAAETADDKEKAQHYEKALQILLSIGVVDCGNFVSQVDTLARRLGEQYPRRTKSGETKPPYLLSAASKFLWMRTQSPVLMYDRLAECWLGSEYQHYQAFVDKWHLQYDLHRQTIEDVAPSIYEFRRFTEACDCNREELMSMLNSCWFQHRVFDHAIIASAQDAER
jgi:hypothetical protein